MRWSIIMRLVAAALVADILTVSISLAAEAVPAPWPTFHGDATLSGVAKSSLPPDLSRLWRLKLGNYVSSTPVAGAGRIYAVADDKLVVAVSTKGKLIWSRRFKLKSDPDAPPRHESFVAPLLYVENRLIAAAESGNVYALDARSGSNLWHYAVGENIQGQPNYTVAEAGKRTAIIVVGQEMGTVHSIDLSSGKAIWVGDGTERCDGSPAVGAGRIVFGSCAAGVHVLSVTNGSELSFIALGEGREMAGGAAISKLRVFSGNRNGEIVAISMKAGSVAWRNADGTGELFTTPAVDDAHVVFASDDGRIHCLDASRGKRMWSFDSGGRTALSPVIVSSNVVAAVDGTVYLLSLRDGKKLWQYEVGDEITSPAIYDGMILVGADDGNLVAFGADEAGGD